MPQPTFTLGPNLTGVLVCLIWQVSQYSPDAVRRSMRALQEVHIKHLGPLVDGRVAKFDAGAFLRDCQRGEAAPAARLWRSMVTTPREGKMGKGWQAKFLGSTFLLGGVMRTARSGEPLSRSPAGLLFGSCLELHNASRHVMSLAAAAHLMPYPQRLDVRTDEQNAERERGWASCLALEGRTAQMAATGVWSPCMVA